MQQHFFGLWQPPQPPGVHLRRRHRQGSPARLRRAFLLRLWKGVAQGLRLFL